MGRVAALLCIVAGCAGTPDDRDLLARIREDGYRQWMRAPQWETALLPAAGGPHGAYLDMFVNDAMQAAIDAGDPIDAWPEGSIVVKDAYADEEGSDLRFIAAMEKEDGAWFWAEYHDDGEVAFAGVEEPTCTGCHDAGADGVLAFDFPEG
jgi:hypothetical protein